MNVGIGRLVAAALLGLATASPGVAQAYPNKPIKFIVTSSPGSAPDLCARVVGQALSEQLKQPVLVEDRAGANGAIAVDLVLAAPADGYTFLATHAAVVSSNPYLYPKAGAKALTELVAVTKLADTDFTLATKSSLHMKSVADLLAYAKANPGKVNFATSSVGSLPNLSAELFKIETALNFLIVPYVGGSQSVSATAMQQTDAVIEAPSVMIPFTQSGQLDILARTGDRRTPRFPNLPTLKELGINMVTSGWIAIMARKGTPDPVLDDIQGQLAKAVHSPMVVERLNAMSFEPVGNSRRQFDAEWKSETKLWERVIRTANIKVE